MAQFEEQSRPSHCRLDFLRDRGLLWRGWRAAHASCSTSGIDCRRGGSHRLGVGLPFGVPLRLAF